MERELRMGYLERVYQRYWRASKESKGRILDELCHVCGYNRKYAIWKGVVLVMGKVWSLISPHGRVFIYNLLISK